MIYVIMGVGVKNTKMGTTWSMDAPNLTFQKSQESLLKQHLRIFDRIGRYIQCFQAKVNVSKV